MLRRGDRRGVDGLRVLIEEMTKRLRSARVVALALEPEKIKAERGTMTSLSSVADRIKAKKLAYASKAEIWGSRLDKLDALEPAAFTATDAAVAAAETDLAGMESDMRALTNAGPPTPLPQSGPGSGG
jgi:hypothetical protein